MCGGNNTTTVPDDAIALGDKFDFLPFLRLLNNTTTVPDDAIALGDKFDFLPLLRLLRRAPTFMKIDDDDR
jgi:hypothetical protein